MPSASFSTVGWHTWKVPKGVKTIKISMDGAGSGSNPGGRVSGNLAVSDTWNLYVLLGEQGKLNSGATSGKGSTGGGGAGGNGQGGGSGGDGGGGASYIRINSKTGSLKAVAGGAGGDSGDTGHGGPGGGTTGGSGGKGTTGTNYTAPATGGTQAQGGNGGTSSAGSAFNGHNAVDTVLATAPTGAQTPATIPSHGGGGGGGGYRAGGSGQAASFGSKYLESTNQVPSPWDTAAVGGTPTKYTAYGPVTRIDSTNLMPNPSLEGGATVGWNSNDSSKYVLALDTASAMTGPNSMKSTRQNGPVASTNLMPNPNLETGSLTGWNSNNGTVYPVAIDATSAMSGVNSVVTTRGATSPSSAVSSINVNSTGSTGFACTPGQPIVCSIDWKADQASRKMTGYFQWLDASLAVLSSQPIQYANQPATTANTIYRFALTGVPPAGTVWARPILGTYTGDGSNAITGERTWFDNFRISTGPVTTDALNLFPNPSVGDNMSGGSNANWNTNNAGLFVVSQEAVAPLTGRYSALVTRQASTPNRQSASISLLGPNTGSAMPITPSVSHTASVDVKAELAGRRIEVYWQWYDSGGVLVGTGTRNIYTNLAANTVTRVSKADTPPANATGARVVLDVTTQDGSNATTGERTWFDSARVSTGAETGFFDGSTAPQNGYVYAWTGTAGASTSQRYLCTTNDMTDAVYYDGSTPTSGGTSYRWTGTVNASTSQKMVTDTAATSVYLQAQNTVPVGFPCTPGTPITASLDVKCQLANRKITFYFTWLDVSGTTIGNSGATNVPIADTGAANTVVRPFVTATPIANTVCCRVVMTINSITGPSSVGELVWMDRLLVSTNPDTTYFDGDTTATPQQTYNWAGTRWASTSNRSWNGNYDFKVVADNIVATNILPNPRFMGNLIAAPNPTACWWTPSRADVVADPAVKRHPTGPQSMKITQNINQAGVYVLTNSPSTPVTNRQQVVPGQQYTFAISVYSGVGSFAQWQMQMYEYDANNAFVGAQTGTFFNCTEGQWTDLRQTFTARPGVTNIRFGAAANGAHWATIGKQAWLCEPFMVQGTYTGGYFDGATVAMGVTSHRWTGTADQSSSQRYVPVAYNIPNALVDINQAMNPSLEGGSIGGWNSNDGTLYALTASTTSPISGTYSAMTTRTATTPSGTNLSAYITGAASAGIDRLPLAPGQVITFALDIRAEAANRRVNASYIRFLDASKAIILSTPSQTPSLPSGVVTRLVHTATAPANTAYAYLYLVIGSSNATNIPTGERVWMDNLKIDFGNDSTYFDGSTPASSTYGYRWNGTANAAISEKYSIVTADLPATDQRPVIQLTNTGGSGQLGARTGSSANIPVSLTAGTTVTFSAWVRLSPDFVTYSLGVQCLMRDDPNNDSLAVTFDARGTWRVINPGAWTRLDWTATVKAGRTVTGIYVVAPAGNTPQLLPVGAYFQTTAWLVNKTAADLPYFDGNTADDALYDFSWAGAVGASISYKHHQTTPYSPGGGGAGGSSFTGGLTGAVNTQGGAGTGNGSITITWSTPAPANLPPTPPSDVSINGVAVQGGMLTKATSSVRLCARINDPNPDQVRLLMRWSTNPSMTSYKQAYTGYVKRGSAVCYTVSGLGQNKHYYMRLYTQDNHGLYSTNYTTVDFWTNKAPWAETNSVNGQGTGMTLPSISSSTFAWTHHDDDVSDYQSGFRIRYRVAATSTAPASAWSEVLSYTGDNTSKDPGPPTSSVNHWTFNPNTFKGNRFYEWSVKTRDGQGLWGAESLLFSFWVSSTTSPPILQTPKDGGALDINNANTFTWKFLDPDPKKTQVNADLRYRAVGATKAIADGESPIAGQWITISGLAGTKTSLTVPEGSFLPEFTYEWEVRTYNTLGGPASDWSDPFFFYAIGTPGADAPPFDLPENAKPQGSLGCGSYRVFIYQQGGQKRIGEVDPASALTFTRVRDDISTCAVTTNGYSEDCGQLYAQVRSWMHELVVYRDGVRVWEGPITLITYTTTSVTFEAKDVMAYVYRRVMRQGYSDAYRLVKKGTGGQPDEYLGLLSVVTRAQELLVQALAPYDPNVLRYLTAIQFDDDAKESRVVASWSRTIWEEIDDLAATAGLDYTTVGRRIILWDTHRSIGRLPELRDGDFSDSPIVTEYGMQLATFFAVTNGSGVAGYTEVSAKTKPYGPIELLASAYSEAEGPAAEVQTPEALEAAQKTLTEQSKRNISGRWPTPLIVRIPDNSTLSPDANVGFQQLIPGVWMPLRSVGTPRQVLQWQKLDSITVEVDDKGEQVKVVLSPAPQGGQDPDADQGGEPD